MGTEPGPCRRAIDNFLSGRTPDRPDVAAARQQTRVKYGFGLNLEQQLTAHCRMFARAGWNEGRYESFAYTEVNQTMAAGAQWSGAAWKRRADKVGVAAAWNAISGDHRRYLELGGTGLLLGDGRLTYALNRSWKLITPGAWGPVSGVCQLVTHLPASAAIRRRGCHSCRNAVSGSMRERAQRVQIRQGATRRSGSPWPTTS